MSTQDNLDLVRRGYDAFSKGDADTLASIFSPDIVHSVPGESPISGDHKGPQEVLTCTASWSSARTARCRSTSSTS